jgi:hypothetical protein
VRSAVFANALARGSIVWTYASFDPLFSAAAWRASRSAACSTRVGRSAPARVLLEASGVGAPVLGVGLATAGGRAATYPRASTADGTGPPRATKNPAPDAVTTRRTRPTSNRT